MEYTIDCSGWEKEKIAEVVSGLTSHTGAKLVLYIGEKEREEEKTREKVAGSYLNRLGVPVHLKGYGYLKYGIARCVAYPEKLESITKILYPEIAKRYKTTPGKVEHGIRHAIQQAWNGQNREGWECIFGKSCLLRNTRPTNSQFMAALSDYISINN